MNISAQNYYSYNVCIGADAGRNSGNYNIGLGRNTCWYATTNNTANSNVYIGHFQDKNNNGNTSFINIGYNNKSVTISSDVVLIGNQNNLNNLNNNTILLGNNNVMSNSNVIIGNSISTGTRDNILLGFGITGPTGNSTVVNNITFNKENERFTTNKSGLHINKLNLIYGSTGDFLYYNKNTKELSYKGYLSLKNPISGGSELGPTLGIFRWNTQSINFRCASKAIFDVSTDLSKFSNAIRGKLAINYDYMYIRADGHWIVQAENSIYRPNSTGLKGNLFYGGTGSTVYMTPNNNVYIYIINTPGVTVILPLIGTNQTSYSTRGICYKFICLFDCFITSGENQSNITVVSSDTLDPDTYRTLNIIEGQVYDFWVMNDPDGSFSGLVPVLGIWYATQSNIPYRNP
jgi:hypothetical protein